MRHVTKKQADAFWYAIPGAWFGSAEPFGPGGDFFAIVDSAQIVNAIHYFDKHKRTVRITQTAFANQSHAYAQGGIRISYAWRAFERASEQAQAGEPAQQPETVRADTC